MNLKEYAESKFLTPGAVTKYMKSHEVEFEGLYTKTGKGYELSDAAIAVLNLHFDRPIEQIVPVEYLEELQALKDENKKLLEKIVQIQEEQKNDARMIATAQAQLLIAEEKQQELEEAKKKNEELLIANAELDAAQKTAEQKVQEQQVKTDILNSELEILKAENERLRSRGFFARLFNK